MKINGGSLWNDPRLHLSLSLAVGGAAAFVVGARPEWLGLAHSPEVGFLQIMFMVVGMGVFAGAAAATLRLTWRGEPWPLAAQIGVRILASGYVTLAASVMADVLGLGSQTWPKEAHFGAVQSYGMLVGEGMMLIGMALMLPYRRLRGQTPSSADEQAGHRRP